MEVAVISGKGGTGKSSITAALASLSQNIVLVDCDVDASNLYLLFNPTHEEEYAFVGGEKAIIDYNRCTHCGLCMVYCRFDAIVTENGKIKIKEVFCDGCHLCSRICPEKAIAMVEEKNSKCFAGSFRYGKMVYGRLAPGEENTGLLVNKVRERAKQIAKDHHIETILLDGPPGIGCPVMSTITGVDRLLLVTEPSLSGIHDMERMLAVAKHFNIETKIIINKYDLYIELSEQIEQKAKAWDATVIAKIPYEPLFVKAMIQQQSIVEFAPDSPSARIIASIYDTVLLH
ncbi:MAG: 4Fe-4S binding protein [Bacteroidales bacterium]|nr:4Fe-4S binding protein [Bacteroidales bacterium]